MKPQETRNLQFFYNDPKHKNFVLLTEAKYGFKKTTPAEIKDSKRELQIMNNLSIKEPKRTVSSDMDDNTKKKSKRLRAPSYLKFIDKNYRQKLFSLKGDQSQVFQTMVEHSVVPLKQQNLNNNFVLKKQASTPTIHTPVSPKLAHESLSKKMTLVSDFVNKDSKPNSNHLNTRKTDFLGLKKSYSNFKSKLSMSPVRRSAPFLGHALPVIQVLGSMQNTNYKIDSDTAENTGLWSFLTSTRRQPEPSQEVKLEDSDQKKINISLQRQREVQLQRQCESLKHKEAEIRRLKQHRFTINKSKRSHRLAEPVPKASEPLTEQEHSDSQLRGMFYLEPN